MSVFLSLLKAPAVRGNGNCFLFILPITTEIAHRWNDQGAAESQELSHFVL